MTHPIAKPSNALLASDMVRHGRILNRVDTRPSRHRWRDGNNTWSIGWAGSSGARCNIRRLKKLEADYEAERRCDKPRDVVDIGEVEP